MKKEEEKTKEMKDCTVPPVTTSLPCSPSGRPPKSHTTKSAPPSPHLDAAERVVPAVHAAIERVIPREPLGAHALGLIGRQLRPLRERIGLGDLEPFRTLGQKHGARAGGVGEEQRRDLVGACRGEGGVRQGREGARGRGEQRTEGLALWGRCGGDG
jgi:hypothetical protein